MKGTRLNRSVVPLFNYEKCLFCQRGNESGVLHDIQANTKDIQLKTAFHECPVALQVYKIRSLGALDAMAGEPNYHQSCWNKIIVNRQVEVCFSSHRSTSTKFTSPTTTRTKFDQSMSPLSPVFPHIKTDVNLENESLENPCMNADIAREIVVVDLIRGVEEALTIEQQVLNIGNIVEVYNARLQEFGVSDSRNAYAIRKYIKRILMKAIPDIMTKYSTDVPHRQHRLARRYTRWE